MPARLAHVVTAVVVGGLVAVAALAGLEWSTEPPPSTERLDLDGYCRELHGERTLGYKPSDPDRWGCTAWVNGIWGMRGVDPAEVCSWQRGPGARLEPRRTETAATGSQRELLCTR